ncbi:MAG: helix-turn-helix domain-containing protein [Gammaproteobacteria bacterium]|nr:helix-turn-helix domain-containing protein [Gammaproteobacteria bacterium]
MLPNDQTLGASLRQAREQAGIELADLAHKLRLQRDIIDALEQDDHSRLPAPTFVRGYLRQYADAVNVDATVWVQHYNQLGFRDPALIDTATAKPPVTMRDPRIKWLTVAIILSLLIYLIYWAVAQSSKPNVEVIEVTESAAVDTVPNETAAIEAALLAAQQEAAVTEDETPEAAVVPDKAAALPKLEPITDAAQVPIAVPVAKPTLRKQAPQGTDRLAVKMTGASWIEVYDANQFRHVYGMFSQKDSPIVLQGQAPFHVMLGDAAQVGLEINGQIYNLQPFVRSNRTAQLIIENE